MITNKPRLIQHNKNSLSNLTLPAISSMQQGSLLGLLPNASVQFDQAITSGTCLSSNLATFIACVSCTGAYASACPCTAATSCTISSLNQLAACGTAVSNVVVTNHAGLIKAPTGLNNFSRFTQMVNLAMSNSQITAISNGAFTGLTSINYL